MVLEIKRYFGKFKVLEFLITVFTRLSEKLFLISCDNADRLAAKAVRETIIKENFFQHAA